MLITEVILVRNFSCDQKWHGSFFRQCQMTYQSGHVNEIHCKRHLGHFFFVKKVTIFAQKMCKIGQTRTKLDRI